VGKRKAPGSGALWYNLGQVHRTANKGGRLISRKGGEAMEVRDAITLMIAFGVLIISLIGLVVNIVAAMTKKK